tara:strand:+ start:240 stop:749 length:510 start_codon:yes stop_codon:yes gene_type:complete
MRYVDIAQSLLHLFTVMVFGVVPLLYIREWWRERGRSHVARDSKLDPKHRLAIMLLNPINLRYIPIDPSLTCVRCGHAGALNAEESLGIKHLLDMDDARVNSVCRFCLRDLAGVFRECVELWQRHDRVYQSLPNRDEPDHSPTPPLTSQEMQRVYDCFEKFNKKMGRKI